jgi:hypothetical protein
VLRSLSVAIFLAPYGVRLVVGFWVAVSLAALVVIVSWAVRLPENRAYTFLRRALIAVFSYLALGLLFLRPFDSALADFDKWYRKGAGVLPGMTQGEAERSLKKRCRFEREQDGEWVDYRLNPIGLAGLHPLRGFASVDLYIVHVRFDPQTSLATEATIVGE